MTEQHFNFVGVDPDYDSSVSLRVDFGGPICRHRLDVCLEELYLQRRFDPEYIFVSGKDHLTITQRVIEYTNFCGPSVAALPRGSLLTRYVNQTTGRLSYFVALPGLPQGNAIFGFFR